LIAHGIDHAHGVVPVHERGHDHGMITITITITITLAAGQLTLAAVARAIGLCRRTWGST
jgi:uncharacterized membrane protein (DUF441 family)